MFRMIEATWLGENDHVYYAVKADTVEAAREVFRKHFQDHDELEGFGVSGVTVSAVPEGAIQTDTPEVYVL
jgi:hypothetical protein